MKTNRFTRIISFFFVSTVWSIIEDKDVTSVLPAHAIQRRANVGGICNSYVDNNYYLYEGEAAFFYPQKSPQFRGPWNSTQAFYDSSVIKVSEAKTCVFDGNINLGAYYGPSVCDAVLLEGIKPGKTTLEIRINGDSNNKVTIPVVVLDMHDDHLAQMNKDACFDAIQKGNLEVFRALLQRGISLSLTNENQENVVVALAKSGHEELIRFLSGYLYSKHNHSDMIQFLTALIAAQNAWGTATVFQYIPLVALEKFDIGGNFQEYAKLHAVNGSLEHNDYETALNLLNQGYPITSVLDDKGFNPLLLAVMHGDAKIALHCIAQFASADLNIAGKDGLNPLMIALREWRSDKQRQKYKDVVEALLAKMNPKDLLYKNPQGKSAWDYAAMSNDPDAILLMKKYIQGKIMLTAQEIVEHVQAFAPGGVWTADLMNQAAQFMRTVKDLGARDDKGNTALMLALQQKRKNVSKILARNVPFPALVTVNKQNESALQIAQHLKSAEVATIITQRIVKEEKEYFYDGIEATCSACVYIPTLNKKEGILSVASCIKGNKEERSGSQEVVVRPVSYVYNGRGRVVVLNRKMEGVFYTARRLDEMFGAQDAQEVVLYGHKHGLSYTTSTAAMKLSDKDFSAIDPQGDIKHYVRNTGYFVAAVYHDLDLAEALIQQKFDPNVINVYLQNPVMAAFQHKSIEIAKKIFPLIAVSGYGQQNTTGKTMLMYAIEARQKDMATTLLNGMKPSDLMRSDHKKVTVYELLFTAGWKDLLQVLQQKVGHLSLFYTAFNQFAYVPNAQGTGGSFTEYANGMTGLITGPNQVIYSSPAGGLATVTINQPVNGVPWNMWAAQNGITISALKSYSTMAPVAVTA